MGWVYVFILVLKKFYIIKEDCVVVFECYMEFFNIYLYVVVLIIGVIFVFEEEKVSGIFVEDKVI